MIVCYKWVVPTFHVTTPGGRYSAVVERGVAGRIPEYLPPRHGKLFVITEQRILDALGTHDLDAHTLLLPGGEPNKRLAPVETLAERMVELGADRSSVIIAFGGGIVTDMAGFLAAIFLRGIPLVQVPTTLLAQVDAAVGGKTGVNLAGGKNLIGSFHQPHAVLIDPAVLHTLPEREFRAGLFEVIKHGIIASPDLFRFLRDHRLNILKRDPAALEYIIAESVRIKAEVVSTDERESGLRRILNFGHTIGHALEAETAYNRFLHGEAVALGMRGAVYLSASAGKLSASNEAAILDLIDAFGQVPSAAGIDCDAVFSRLVRDKKTQRGRVHFVLPLRVGATEVVSGLDDGLVRNAIERSLR